MNFINLNTKIKAKHKRIIFVNSLIITGIVLLPYYYEYLQYVPHFCLFNEIFSISCPGCGVLSSLNAIMNMDYSINSGNLISIVFIIYFSIDLILRAYAFINDTDINKQLLKLNHIFTFLLIGNWILFLI